MTKKDKTEFYYRGYSITKVFKSYNINTKRS